MCDGKFQAVTVFLTNSIAILSPCKIKIKNVTKSLLFSPYSRSGLYISTSPWLPVQSDFLLEPDPGSASQCMLRVQIWPWGTARRAQGALQIWTCRRRFPMLQVRECDLVSLLMKALV